jgi:hypothetical protein
MPIHEQKFVKVNVPVDKGISGIICALSNFSTLETVESCEGNQERGPWVCFYYGEYWEHDWRELAEFVLNYLAPGLYAAVGDDVNVKIQTTPSGVFGEISVRPGATNQVEKALYDLSKNFISCRSHNSACSDDIPDTCP